jgi:DnaJ-class molecular chaperone
MKYNLYSTLGVKPKATMTEIKKSYRKIAMENHPDKNPNNKAAAKKMLDANEAYEVLSDPIKKKKYDDALMAHLQSEINKEKAKQARTEQRQANSHTSTKEASDAPKSESIPEYLKNAGKSVLVGILRTILRR